MNNPHSDDSRYALAPYPAGVAGHRLWSMLNDVRSTPRITYMRALDRRNLVEGRAWNRSRARTVAEQMIRDGDLRGRTVLLLGEEVRRAFGLPRVLLHPVRMHGATFRQLPHPSGRCRWYNQPVYRIVAGLLMEELVHGEA